MVKQRAGLLGISQQRNRFDLSACPVCEMTSTVPLVSAIAGPPSVANDMFPPGDRDALIRLDVAFHRVRLKIISTWGLRKGTGTSRRRVRWLVQNCALYMCLLRQNLELRSTVQKRSLSKCNDSLPEVREYLIEIISAAQHRSFRMTKYFADRLNVSIRQSKNGLR